MSFHSLLLSLKGGSGSGNHGHAGRKGKRGGSTSSILPSNFSYDTFIEITGTNAVNDGQTRIAALYVPEMRSVIAPTQATGWHEQLAEEALHNKNYRDTTEYDLLDNSVHITLHINNVGRVAKIGFDMQQSGVGVYDTSKENKALTNIYAAMDNLTARNFPNVPVKIIRARVGQHSVDDIETSLKECFWRKLCIF